MDLRLLYRVKKVKDKCHVISVTYGIENMTQTNLFTKVKQIHRQKKPMVTDGEGGGGILPGDKVGRDKLGDWD